MPSIFHYFFYMNCSKNIHRNIIHIDVLHLNGKKGNVLVCYAFRSLSHWDSPKWMDDCIFSNFKEIIGEMQYWVITF